MNYKRGDKIIINTCGSNSVVVYVRCRWDNRVNKDIVIYHLEGRPNFKCWCSKNQVLGKYVALQPYSNIKKHEL